VQRCDALIVGGGPAGSTCARLLRRAGWDVLVADAARFPRDKVCAGWITPEVLGALELDAEEYRGTGLTFQDIAGFRTGVLGGGTIDTRYPRPVSYAIRRCEFDHFLLSRAGVRVLEGTRVERLRRRGDTWRVNDAIETPIVVGAGGHFCPVARHLQGTADRAAPIVAKELEFRVDGGRSPVPADLPELFFCRDLEGYGWCVRKGDYLNVGIGRRDRLGFAAHVRDFAAFLVATGRVTTAAPERWHGHANFAGGAGVRPLAAPGVLLVGDAAGLAYAESGEGIRPAVESGAAAARALIAASGRFADDEARRYAALLASRYKAAAGVPRVLQPAVAPLGRALLQHSPSFTRRFVIDKWFLRTA
jgi:geranylgeranyl reductase family protein